MNIIHQNNKGNIFIDLLLFLKLEYKTRKKRQTKNVECLQSLIFFY